MPKNEICADSSKLSTPKADKGTALGRRLLAAAGEALAHARGEVELRTYEVAVPESVDAGEIRRALGLSQREFATRFGLDLGAVQAWEQGRRRPERAARILLAVIAREPEAVLRALRAA